MNTIPPGLRYLAGAALSFSIMAAMAKLAGLAIPLFELVFARSVVVAVLAGWDVHRRRMDWRGRERGLLVLRGFFGFAALTCFYYAVLRMPLADATVIHFMNPVFTALAAAVVL
ncbi:MAG: EamA family transporter, partial [Gemmatimonadota bacterium]|nr:EamA family transporter [Gemmatimonadota bacterium]